ncbi:LA_3751/LA_3752 family putative glycosyltransferase [Leptospira paudalimensis]|uniref:Glycosyltransferase RgtA/B/C/D-like domain-containing protein n=1 Tax=Leptospira paudalimensis TaxID=2950024 RepID=A0ABT3M5V3_9LEPT|nr:hypothetical protein [Leptospira paudalimensis]MCW7503774.1 hypothetical protein [Leptospira paudalimensis]
MNFYYRGFIYFLILLVPIFYRWKWNEGHIFISSDPQIKYYQVVHAIQGGSVEACFFPASEIGFKKEQIPIGYPWAFFLKNGDCVFQYPSLFVWVQKIFLIVFDQKFITYFPILIFLLNFLILDRILQLFENRPTYILITTIFIQVFSPVFLSSLDYSELTLTNFFLLLAIYSYVSFARTPKYYLGLLLSLSIVLNFQLRPESSIALVLFLATAFLLSESKILLLKRLIPYILLAFLLQSFYFTYNNHVYGHILGMRGLNTVNDLGSNELQRNYLGEWIADLWGNDFKIGIFKGYPILFLSSILIWQRKRNELSPFLISGLVFILILPILSPYRAGVDIFGMRYYESGIYLLLIATFPFIWKLKPKFLLILILLPCLYFSYKSDTRAIKQWTSSSKVYKEIMSEIQNIHPDLIVHRGLSLSYLMGESYVTYPQIAIFSNEDWLRVEETLKNRPLKILYLQWEGNRLVKDEFPKNIWQEKFDINFQLKPKEYSIQSEYKIAHFQGFLLEKKH